MPAIKLNGFGGMIPAMDDRLLPDNMAVLSENTWLYAGTLEGIPEAKAVHTCASSLTKTVYRIPTSYTDRQHIADSTWMEWPYEYVDVIKAPIADDTYNRYYWTSLGTGPQYNTLNRIRNGTAPLTLGVPYPTTFPGVSASGGTSETTVSRAYVYTWVTQYGEEGAPSAPGLATGKQDATWTITITPPTDAQKANRLLDKQRIYRTITSSNGVATYFFVAEVSLTTTSYSDTAPDVAISSNDNLSSTGWTPPPSDLTGMISMPNGIIAGFRSNELWFCQPYRPHAWPVSYILSVDSTIIGLGVVGQTLVVCTQTSTYSAIGINPTNMTLSKLSTQEPCTSRGSIVSTPQGVFYASPNGVVLVASGQVRNATEKLFTKDTWQDAIRVDRLRAAQFDGTYYMFGGISSGCYDPSAFETTAFEQKDYTGSTVGGIIDTDNRVAFNRLTSTEPTISVSNDPWTNEVFVLRNGVVYQIDVSSSRPRSQYTWRSKRFQTPNKRNLEAMKIYFDNPENLTDLGTVKIYADNRLVSTRPLTKSGVQMRLPSGFKADFWQVEITSRVTVSSIQMATSARELASV